MKVKDKASKNLYVFVKELHPGDVFRLFDYKGYYDQERYHSGYFIRTTDAGDACVNLETGNVVYFEPDQKAIPLDAVLEINGTMF